MAERGKAEESQLTEALGPGSRDELHGVVEHLQAVFGDSADVQLSYSTRAAGSPTLHVRVKAQPVLAKAQAGEVQVETTTAEPNELGPDMAVDRDDAYYDEVREAVGRGAPSVLLGTSTKSLEANVRKIQAAQQTRSPGAPPPDRTGRIWRRRFRRAALPVLIVALGLSTLLLILIWHRQSSLDDAIQTSVLVVSASLLLLSKLWARYHKSEKDRKLDFDGGRVGLPRRAKGDSSPEQSEQAAEDKKS